MLSFASQSPLIPSHRLIFVDVYKLGIPLEGSVRLDESHAQGQLGRGLVHRPGGPARANDDDEPLPDERVTNLAAKPWPSPRCSSRGELGGYWRRFSLTL